MLRRSGCALLLGVTVALVGGAGFGRSVIAAPESHSEPAHGKSKKRTTKKPRKPSSYGVSLRVGANVFLNPTYGVTLFDRLSKHWQVEGLFLTSSGAISASGLPTTLGLAPPSGALPGALSALPYTVGTVTQTTNQFGGLLRNFIWESLSVAGGLAYTQTTQQINLTPTTLGYPYVQVNRQTGSIDMIGFIGSQWHPFDHVTLGVDWLGASLPIYTMATSTTLSGAPSGSVPGGIPAAVPGKNLYFSVLSLGYGF